MKTRNATNSRSGPRRKIKPNPNGPKAKSTKNKAMTRAPTIVIRMAPDSAEVMKLKSATMMGNNKAKLFILILRDLLCFSLRRTRKTAYDTITVKGNLRDVIRQTNKTLSIPLA